MQKCTEIYITDKSNKKYFKTLCATEYQDSEFRNLERKLKEAHTYPQLYRFLDLQTAHISSRQLTIGD